MSENTEATKETEAKAPKRGVGNVAIEAILAGKSNEEALAQVKAEFPNASTSMSSINWYRNKLRSEGHPVKTARELKADAKPKGEKKGEKKSKKAAATTLAEVEDADPLD